MSIQGEKWLAFSEAVIDHIENYVVPQYGDEGSDLATEYSTEDCIKQVEKYLKRFGRNARPGQEKRDLLKAAHYVQKAFDKLDAPLSPT